jgi:hypothetical protein
MLGFNGGLMGIRRTPTTSAATGLWFQNEQCDAQRAAIWPPSARVGTYSQSSVYSGTTAASAAIMTDNSFTNTGAATNSPGGGNDAWIKIDYGVAFTIGSVTVGTATNNIPGGWAKSDTEGCNVQTSTDDTTWTTLFTIPGLPAEGIYTYTAPSNFTAVSARYIRLRKNGGYVAASEFYAS